VRQVLGPDAAEVEDERVAVHLNILITTGRRSYDRRRAYLVLYHEQVPVFIRRSWCKQLTGCCSNGSDGQHRRAAQIEPPYSPSAVGANVYSLSR